MNTNKNKFKEWFNANNSNKKTVFGIIAAIGLIAFLAYLFYDKTPENTNNKN